MLAALLCTRLMNDQSTISKERFAQFHDEGYVIFESIIPPDHLSLLRAACDKAIEAVEARMDASGIDHQGINHPGVPGA